MNTKSMNNYHKHVCPAKQVETKIGDIEYVVV